MSEKITSTAELKKKRSPIYYCEDCESFISDVGNHSADHTIKTIWVIEEEYVNSFEAGLKEVFSKEWFDLKRSEKNMLLAAILEGEGKQKEMLKLEADDRGTPSRSLKFYYINQKRLGKLLKAEVKSTKITHPNPHFCYLVFEKGIVHFTGLNCGYIGTGPHGLAEILFKEGFFKTIEEAVAYAEGHDEIEQRRGA